ncbi:MAG: hypothetical protein KF713_18605 [Turneriella sp.]|nr:hypothetical protein [Turneriella sp.]
MLVLSLRLLKTAANAKLHTEKKGLALQRVMAAQKDTLDQVPDALSAADGARITLAGYFRKLSGQRVRSEI